MKKYSAEWIKKKISAIEDKWGKARVTIDRCREELYIVRQNCKHDGEITFEQPADNESYIKCCICGKYIK